MNNIVTELVKIINDNPSLIEIEMSVETCFTALMSDLFSQAIERVDLESIQEYKEEGYEIDRIEKRTVQFSHGAIHSMTQRIGETIQNWTDEGLFMMKHLLGTRKKSLCSLLKVMGYYLKDLWETSRTASCPDS